MRVSSAVPLRRKLGIRPGHRVSFVRAPASFREALGDPGPDVRVLSRPGSGMDVIILFATRAGDLAGRFEALADRLSPAGGLWVAWPKRSSAIPGDLSFETVQGTGLGAGLVDNKSCSIDEDWQALRFVVRVSDRPGSAPPTGGS